MLVLARRFAPKPVDRPIARGGDDPPGRARRYAGLRPLLHRRREPILYGVLRDLQIAEDPRQYGDRPPMLGPEHPGDVDLGHTPVLPGEAAAEPVAVLRHVMRRTGGPRRAAL